MLKLNVRMLGYILLISLLVANGDLKKPSKDYCLAKCTKVKPVCGNDGKDYQSRCHLKQTNCLSNTTITVLHQGKCESCPQACSKVYKPVCGSNEEGKERTFLNVCHLKKEMCQVKDTKKIMTIKKKGPCKAWQHTNCPDGCQDIWAPVCASDGKTYSSICAVKMVRCTTLTEDNKPMKIKKVGYCNKGMCPEFCPQRYSPTCGNDGIVYANECELRLAACKTGKLKTLKKEKKKSKCRKKCVKNCPTHTRSVCGSDGITYQNECVLKQKNCLENKKITIARNESCDDKDQLSNVLLEAELIQQIVPAISAPSK